MNLTALFAGPAGKTALIALSASLGIVTFLALTVFEVVVRGQPFAYDTWALAWGGVLGASAAAIAGHAWGQAQARAASTQAGAPADGAA